MAAQKLISIVIATYNRGYIVCDAINSVLNQTYKNLELIVVDDGSTDDTLSKLKVYGSNIQVIRQANGGPAVARNSGISVSNGDFVAFLDSDDLWEPRFLERHVEVLHQFGSTIAGTFCDLQLVTAGEHIKSIVRCYPQFSDMISGLSGDLTFLPQQRIYQCMLEEMPVKLPAAVLNREAVMAAGMFLESWRSGEDWEFFLRFTKVHALVYIDSPLVIIRTQPDSTLAKHKTADARNLLERFVSEKRTLDDRKQREAIRRGIAHHAKELGWQLLSEGNRGAAFSAYFQGFAESSDPSLFGRSLGTLLPRKLRDVIKSLKDRYE